jgi:quercetin dioxygenase-like cupin family protein
MSMITADEEGDTAMAGIHRKSFEAADEELPLGEKAGGDVVKVAGFTAKRAIFEPGWRWTEHVSAELCTTRHVGYVVSGRLRVVMDDGRGEEIRPGDAVVIDPGHDAWTVGEEACVFVDFGDSVGQ